MTALLEAAALAERLAVHLTGFGDLEGFRNQAAAQELRLLASHARASARRVTLVERADGNDIDVLVDGIELPDLGLFSMDGLASVVRALGGTIELVRRPQGDAAGERITANPPSEAWRDATSEGPR